MRFTIAMLPAAVLGLALAACAYADTRSSDDKPTMERKAAPSGPKLDEERAESSQGQPNVPSSIGGATVRDTSKDNRTKGKKPDKSSSTAGGNAPGSGAEKSGADKDQAFKRLDMDGDGSISKAEAAGNAKLMTGFDAADKDHDGKLSRAEYDSMSSAPQAKPKAKNPAKLRAQPAEAK